uniref:Serpentine Receptor, class T n=1 Tax=Meloidogyne incognita TaxID=6306 RepID=A0A914LUG3_MELIC
MDIYLFKPKEYQRLYNCSLYNIKDIPLEDRQHIFLGVVLIQLFFILEFLYILCVLAIRKHLENSCYKIMFYIGINDIFCLFICGLLTGILALNGAVFCSFPNTIYIAGMVACVFWYNETLSAILLALNRCVEISMPSIGERLFRGYKTWLWMLLPLFYGILFGPTFKPVLFSGVLFSWFYNPHVGYIDDFGTIYDNPMVSFNNFLVVTLFPGSYLLFVVILICKGSSVSALKSTSRSQKKIFIQVMLISSINIIAGIIYVYMQFFRINKYIIYTGMFGWFFAHGSKPIVYLSLNNTIQRDVLKMLCLSRLNRIAATTMQINIGGTTQHTTHKNPTETRNQSRIITRHEEVF